ncbi:ImmA/IrrE family metallo-endopeptidase [Veillonella montpellierensis]|uniref:ImmA/IrrE family metallo-endopeptidase n=1 Tax=Veillonella montpellierensis TaxID=187328 RepID=UPI0023F641A0|nr:ImmA/IrrE family metallo-endopeptidase [Veillonella montpellierensis]
MNIKGTVETLIKKYNTTDPFAIANALGIRIVYENLGAIYGYFDVHFRVKKIHLNNSIDESLLPFVCAHELGHSVLHPSLNTPFLSQYTLFSIDKIERQANTFAVELLLSDTILTEYSSINFFTLAKNRGIPEGLELLKFK